MKIIPFPGGGAERLDEDWLTELEAALDGSAEGPHADSWRELHGDVRALVPPMSPEFERELSERIAERITHSGQRSVPHPRAPRPNRRGAAGVGRPGPVVPRLLPSRWRAQ